jgi:hypothetical protein
MKQFGDLVFLRPIFYEFDGNMVALGVLGKYNARLRSQYGSMNKAVSEYAYQSLSAKRPVNCIWWITTKITVGISGIAFA